MTKQRPYCLTIAGFDPSGGAGIVADCKTFEQLKVHGLSVITCNTIQTEDQFYDYNWITIETILEQTNKLLDRYPIHFIKIGLVKDVEMLTSILNLLHARIEKPTIIWDPILQPSYGGEEVEQDRFLVELPSILEKITILTPNLPEYKRLFGKNIPSDISKTYNKTLYLKGGHAEIKGKDLLYHKGEIYPINPKMKTDRQKHGTGCIFSSALTAYLSREFPLIKSCLRSKEYVEKRIISNPTLLAYHK